MANAPMSGMTQVSSVDGDEEILVLEGTTSKVLTTDQMQTYTIEQLTGATAATPATGDKLFGDRSDTERLFDLDDVSDYVVDYVWSDVSAADSGSAGDTFLINRSGTKYTFDIDDLTTYVTDGLQSTILDVSSLDSASLGATDYLLIVQGSTAKQTQLSDLETKLWSDFATYVGNLSDITTVADADVFYTLDGGSTAKYSTAAEMATYVYSEKGSTIIDDVWDDATAKTSAADADNFVFERSGTRYTINAQYIADYVISEFDGESAVSPAADGDDLAMWRSGTAGTMTVDVLATYVQDTILDDFSTQTSLNDSDTFLFNRSSSGNQITASNLASYVQTEIEDGASLDPDGLDFSGLASATLNSTDEYLLDQSGTAKKTTLSDLETQLWTDFATYVADLTDISTVADADVFYILDGGSTAKYATATELATYVSSEMWSASAAGSVSGTDTFLMDASGTKKEATLTQVTSYVSSNVQSDMLDLSGVADAGALSATDHALVSQSSTPGKLDLSDLSDWILARLDSYTSDLDAATSVADADVFYMLQSGSTAKKVTAANIASYAVEQANSFPWVEISTSNYTATPSSTSQITMSDTSDVVEVGYPVKYAYGGTTYYGIVTAVAANASITIAGAPLNVAQDLTALYVGSPVQVCQEDFFIGTAFGDAVQDIFSAVTYERFRWGKADAYLVAFSGVLGVVDGGASQPKVNVKVAGSAVSTEDSNKGITLSSSAGTWVDSSAVAIDTTNYAIARGDSLDVRCTEAGTDGDADCLTLSCIFVLE